MIQINLYLIDVCSREVVLWSREWVLALGPSGHIRRRCSRYQTFRYQFVREFHSCDKTYFLHHLFVWFMHNNSCTSFLRTQEDFLAWAILQNATLACLLQSLQRKRKCWQHRVVLSTQHSVPPDSKNRLSYPRCTKVVATWGATRSSSSYNITIFPGMFLCGEVKA